MSPATTRRKLASVRAYAKFLGNAEFLADYTSPKLGKAVPHPILEGADGIRKLMFVARDSQERALIALTFMVGLRVSEALSISVESFGDFDKTLTVRGKGDKTRIVPVSDRAQDILDERLAEILAEGDTTVKLITCADKTARRKITRMGQDAGLGRRISSHDGRATFATLAHRNGASLRVLQELMGHASPNTTQVYTGVDFDDMRSAVNNL